MLLCPTTTENYHDVFALLQQVWQPVTPGMQVVANVAFKHCVGSPMNWATCPIELGRLDRSRQIVK